ncbi:helix-turn-helix transcriptional regulator [Nodosilinea sp. LEGE 06152]|uniref:helix-turn-helix domain-containing protein n=1 Tax=Nodosilinea sp. LEGE 06152 TaxID=2777966 RepID=UPI00187ED3D2|nr:helix-turn-helix transcriptional regulator [Nodosilinea sp. LEGE 06152]MBE9155298.1 helix-turn-helix transcriptional regulator [Nodosilinea sp. LEGE 06152]
MKPGSKYHPLHDHLKHSDQTEVVLTFAEVEALLGSALPHSAVERKNWWSNRETPAALQSSAWVRAGYHVHAIDIDSKVVTFCKVEAQYNIQTRDGKIIWQQDAIRALRKHMNLTQMEFAEQMGVRRQTISEWENGVYEPDRSTAKFLELIAKHANFEAPAAENP